MENKSTANKWLIAAVIVMGIAIVAMATWIIAGAMHKNSDSNSSVKTSQTKKDSSDSLEKTRGEGEELSNEAKKEYKDCLLYTSGAKRVVISGPTKSEGVDTIVLGTNDDKVKNATPIVSNASCTTNSLGAVMAILDAEDVYKRQGEISLKNSG